MVNASELLINAVIDDKPHSDTAGLGQKARRRVAPLYSRGTRTMNLSAERQDLTLPLVLIRNMVSPYLRSRWQRAGRP